MAEASKGDHGSGVRANVRTDQYEKNAEQRPRPFKAENHSRTIGMRVEPATTKLLTSRGSTPRYMIHQGHRIDL